MCEHMYSSTFVYGLVVSHGLFKDGCQLLSSRLTGRCKLGDTVLGQSAFDKLRNHRAIKTKTLQTIWHIEFLKEVGQFFSKDITSHGWLNVGRIGTEGSCGINVTIRASVGGETEHRRSGEGYRDTMRNQRMINLVTRVSVILVQTANGVT